MGKSAYVLLLLSMVMLATRSHADDPYVCNPERYKKLGIDMASLEFCDKSLPFAVRVKSLVDTMTLEEKAVNLGSNAAGVPRLGLPYYNWWSEALHGVSDTGGGSHFDAAVPGATSFPSPILSAASFNETLWKAIGKAVSTEARAMHNLRHAGQTFWSPNINIVRDPRWGRALETSGEDPYLTGRYAVNFVRGLQDVEGQETALDPNTRPLKVAACCKHYAAYDLDHWTTFDGSSANRVTFNAIVTEQEMVETFQKPFETCVREGDVSAVMCSYNQIDKIPACTNARLLRGTIRGDWNLHGYIVTDCDSVGVIYRDQKWLNDDPEDSVAQTMRAGVDLDCLGTYKKYLLSTVRRGLLSESDLDAALTNNYMVLMRLGYFDGNEQYANLGKESVCSQEHRDLALEAARQSIVLVKNRQWHDFHLPLDPETYSDKKILVVGPHARATDAMLGNYRGPPCGVVTPAEGFAKYGNVEVQIGCADVKCHNDTFIYPAVRAAYQADVTILMVGLDLSHEAEDRDRTDLELPGFQSLLVRQVARVATTRGPVIMVMMSGGPLSMYQLHETPDIDAILWAGYPGEQGGQAIADIIFGQYNPSGRLPLTWYPGDYVRKLPMTSMQLRPNPELGYPGRTYKFFDDEKIIYPFGHGLSYSDFTYEVVSTQRSITKKLEPSRHCHQLKYNDSAKVPPCHSAAVEDLDCDDDIEIDVKVYNTQPLDGVEVVLLYSRAPEGLLGTPIKTLVGFQKVFVQGWDSTIVSFSLSSCKSLSIVTDTAYVVLPTGEHTFIVGTEGTWDEGVKDHVVKFPFHVDVREY